MGGLLAGFAQGVGKKLEERHQEEEKQKAEKRALYQQIIFDPNTTQAGRDEAAQQLQKLLNPEAKKGLAKILPIFGKLTPPQQGQQSQPQATPQQQQPGASGPLQPPPPIGAQPQQGAPAQPPPLQQLPNGRPTLRQPLQPPPPISQAARTPPFTPPGNQQQPQGQPAAAAQQGGIAGMLSGYDPNRKTQQDLDKFKAEKTVEDQFKQLDEERKATAAKAQALEVKQQKLTEAQDFAKKYLPPEKQEEFMREYGLKEYLGTTELATDKSADKDTKATNIHVQVGGEWKPALEHPDGKITALDGSAIDPKSIQDVNKTGAVPAKYSGELGERVNANKIIADPKSTPEEKAAAQATLKNLDQKAKGVEVRINNAGAKASEDKDEAQTIAEGIMSGRDTPDLTGMGRSGLGGRVRAILDKQGFEYQKAKLDYDATKRYVNSLNSTQQIRLRQAVEFTAESVDKVEDLYEQWQKTGLPGGFKSFNHAALVAASHLPGQQGAIAQTLLTQINDLTSEMGTVYKGGNSSTDESLKLASSNLSADWNDATFKSALNQLRKNLQIRKNSLNTANIGPVKAGEPSPNGKLEAPPKGGASSTIDDLVKKYGGK